MTTDMFRWMKICSEAHAVKMGYPVVRHYSDEELAECNTGLDDAIRAFGNSIEFIVSITALGKVTEFSEYAPDAIKAAEQVISRLKYLDGPLDFKVSVRPVLKEAA